MRRYTRKISFRLSDTQESELRRIEEIHAFRTRSSLMKEALSLLSREYPDREKEAKEKEMFGKLHGTQAKNRKA